MALWLGERRGYFSDWLTQLWVRATGRRFRKADVEWLAGPTGGTRQIGEGFFAELAASEGFELAPAAGLLADLGDLGLDGQIDPVVVAFYERTAEYEVDAWAEWAGLFRPFGVALASLFSRRLQQLNVPLSALDTAKGMTSELIALRTPEGDIAYTAWVRKLLATRNVIYAGSYSVCVPPAATQPHVKVVFPLPNGNAIVVMEASAGTDGSLLLSSAGPRFGHAGFYFTLLARENNSLVARYVKSLRETIHVYRGDREGDVRADHDLRLWGRTFLRIHYRMRRKPSR